MSGLIYKISSPSGKNYIGQTVQTFDRRMIVHKSAAKNVDKKDGCRALNSAIRKYEWKNMTKEVLETCEIDELDEKEQQYIEEYNSMAPNGYNLISGGNSNKKFSDETKSLQREAALKRDVEIYRTKNLTKGWPKYLGTSQGSVRISKHPKCSCKTFNDPDKTFEENLEDAKAFLEKLNNGEEEVIIPQRELPKGIQKMGDGYRVGYKDANGKVKYKRFGVKSVSSETKLAQAIAFLQTIESESEESDEEEIDENDN